MEKDLSILCFTWNTESVRLCEKEGMAVGKSTWTRNECSDPDFTTTLLDDIKNSHRKYDIVAIGFQEDASPGSYFHSHVLPERMNPEFSLISREKAMGLGISTVKALKKGDIKTRGLRLSIYASRELLAQTSLSYTTKTYYCEGKDEWTGGKGGLYVSIFSDLFGKIVIMDAHLPFNSKSLKIDQNARDIALKEQTECLHQIIGRTMTDENPNYFIIMGDLNFRVMGMKDSMKIFNETIEDLRKIYDEKDELKHELQRLPFLSEGVGGAGPRFAPTCKMRKSRESGCIMVPNNTNGCYKLGLENQRNASWCDRILYGTISDRLQVGFETEFESINLDGTEEEEMVVGMRRKTLNPMSCILYDRWEFGETMRKSDHSAVLGVFIIPLSKI